LGCLGPKVRSFLKFSPRVGVCPKLGGLWDFRGLGFNPPNPTAPPPPSLSRLLRITDTHLHSLQSYASQNYSLIFVAFRIWSLKTFAIRSLPKQMTFSLITWGSPKCGNRKTVQYVKHTSQWRDSLQPGRAIAYFPLQSRIVIQY